ncbi:MAG: hypothetical protein ABI868_13430 [Acidobacteriota bacterium]
MAMTTHLGRYAGRKLTRRLIRSMPWIGGLVALATLRNTVRRKGVLGGALHTALDFIPFVGGAKTLAEAGRGRDFFPDKPISPSPVPHPSDPRSPR